ncbi:MAG: ABC transporter permease [Archangium sp.]|nr:ABC transporter permease [Archangium sp.]
MRSLLRLISIRHLAQSPLRSALTILGVAIGVATLVGIASINRTVMAAFRSTIDTISGKADLTVSASALGFSEDVLEKVRQVPGVAHAAGGLTMIVPVKDAPGESLYVMGVDLLDDGFFRTYEGVDRDVTQLADDLEFLNSTDRILVSERFAGAHNLKTGSTFSLITTEGTREFTVHGLLKETGPVRAFGGSVAVMFFGSAQEAFARGRTFDRVDIARSPDVELDELQKRVQAALGPTFEVERPDRRGQSVETMVRSFQLGLNLGSAVALVVGIFLVYNTVSIGVVQRRREIGTLRALGATKRTIRAMFTLEAAVLGAIGSVLGLPLGVLVGRLAISFVSQSVSTLYVRVNAREVHVGLVEVALGLTLGIFGSMFAALRPAAAASGVQPVEALRRDVVAGAGAAQLRSWPTLMGVMFWALAYPVAKLPPPIENLPLGGYFSIFFILMGGTLLSPLLLRTLNRPFAKPGEWLFGIAGRMAADNFARTPMRTAVPVSALAIGVAMTVTLSSFIDSFQHSATKWIDQSIPADLFITSSSKVAGVANQPLAASLGDELVKVPGVDRIDRVRLMQHDVLGLRVIIISLTPDVYNSRGKPDVREGRLPTDEERQRGFVTISENFSRRRDLHPGSTFPVITPTGERTYTVGAVIVDYTSDQGAIIMDRQVFAQHFGDDRVDSFHLYIDDPSRIEAVRKEVTERYAKEFNLYVLSNGELHQEALSLIDNAFAVTHAMEVAAIALALLGVVNTLLAAVIDRTREIGLLRAIGADRKQIMQLFTGEAVFIGLTGGVVGTVLGVIVGYVVTKVINVQATGWDLPFRFSWSVALSTLVLSTVAAVIAGLYPARRAASLDVVEALAYE